VKVVTISELAMLAIAIAFWSFLLFGANWI
jgi:hypothetical protein